jgi:hypothetical protein
MGNMMMMMMNAHELQCCSDVHQLGVEKLMEFPRENSRRFRMK